MSTRWDELLASRPMPLVDYLVAEVARVLAHELQQWPPPIQELDPATVGTFATLFAEDARAPHPAVYPEAFRLARWSLLRELDAYDDYLRNRRYLAAGLPASDRTALLFLQRWLEEQMLALGEATGGRLKRPRLAECLTLTEQAFSRQR